MKRAIAVDVGVHIEMLLLCITIILPVGRLAGSAWSFWSELVVVGELVDLVV